MANFENYFIKLKQLITTVRVGSSDWLGVRVMLKAQLGKVAYRPEPCSRKQPNE
jgi:hypothetical protein